MNKLLTLALTLLTIPTTHYSHLFLIDYYESQKYSVDQVFNLPSPEITKITSIGFDNFVTDILWLKLIQYYGSHEVSELLPELYSLVNNILTLDPKFVDAYILSSYALSDNKEFDKAVNILERGIKENPNEWFLSYQLGFLYYIYKKNRIIAAKYLKQASDNPNAPLSIKPLAAMMYESIKNLNDYDLLIELWKQSYNKAKESGDTSTMERAYKKIIEITIKKDLYNLNIAIEKYKELREKNKNLPNLQSIEDLKNAGLISSIPLDPFNRPYILNTKTLTVEIPILPWK
jgi:tetratricopeptide (TPR) repeat protein